jgi:hypothetical protein
MKEKFGKAGRVLLLLFGAFGALCAFTIVLNLYDPLLRPEVQKVLEEKPVTKDAQLRAFHYLVGLTADRLEDPEAEGHKLWEEFQALPIDRQAGFFEKQILRNRKLWEVPYFTCRPSSSQCGTADLEKNPDLAIHVTRAQTQLKQYMKLVDYGAAAIHFRGNEQIPFVVLHPWNLKMHRLMLLQWALWLRKGGEVRVLDSIENSNRQLYSMMETGTLLDRLVSLVMMHSNLEFLVEESARDAALKAQITPELIESFRSPDADELMYGAMDSELRTFANAVRSIRVLNDLHLSEAEVFTAPAPSLVFKLLNPRFFFRPNETINRYYDVISQSLATDCPEISAENETQCVPAIKWARARSPIAYLENPLGRAFVQIFSASVTRTRARVKDRIEKLYQLKESLSS